MSDSTDRDREVVDRLDAIRSRIHRAAEAAGRSADDVTLVAVSKRQPLWKLRAAYETGQRDFGENYLQAMEERRGELPGDVRWHFIGHPQSKKAPKLVWAHLIHGVDSIKLGDKLARAALDQGEAARCLLQVNISGEGSKSGISPAELPAIARRLCDTEGLEVRGLMCIPAAGGATRAAFAQTRELRDRLRNTLGRPLPELSMGMSGDFPDAIAEGATIVRVGSALFGPRE